MSSYKVLLGEDNTDVYNLFLKGFEKISTSFCISRVRNGPGCITYLKTHDNPDIIFLTLNIPLKSGLECLKFIKNTEPFEHIPVIIYSTSHYIKHIDAAFKGGAHYYFIKPGNADLLVDTLHTVLDRLDENPQPQSKETFVIRNVVTLKD
jgi:CheY-like chemotaxis protein